jgi:hypothetical protein
MVGIIESIEYRMRINIFEGRVLELEPFVWKILDPVREYRGPFDYNEKNPNFNISAATIFNAYRPQYALWLNRNEKLVIGGLSARSIISLIDIYLRTQALVPIRVLDKNFLIKHEYLESAGLSQIIVVEYIPPDPLRLHEPEKGGEYIIRYG